VSKHFFSLQMSRTLDSGILYLTVGTMNSISAEKNIVNCCAGSHHVFNTELYNGNKAEVLNSLIMKITANENDCKFFAMHWWWSQELSKRLQHVVCIAFIGHDFHYKATRQIRIFGSILFTAENFRSANKYKISSFKNRFVSLKNTFVFAP